MPVCVRVHVRVHVAHVEAREQICTASSLLIEFSHRSRIRILNVELITA